MIRGAAIVVALVLTAALGFAQEATPKIQVFAGYSLFHADKGRLTPLYAETTLHAPLNSLGVQDNFNGWNAEAQYNFSRWVGVVADFGGRYGSVITGSRGVSGIPSGSGYTFMAGPVISYRTKSPVTPFAHVLFGYDVTRLSASTITGVPNPITSLSTSYTDAAVAFGGGVDYKVSRRFAVRVGQLDWYHTSLNLNKFYGSAFGIGLFQGLSTKERNWRVSSGVVVRF